MPDELTTDDLTAQLRDACGVRAGSVLIAHAGLKAIGRVAGGAAAVVAALRAALGPAGTLLMPTFSHPTPDGVWRMAATPSRTGAVTEALRTTPGAARSWHPTHPVSAIGARAAELTAGHEATSGLGVGSPFHRAAEAGADVLMIGCDLTSCSLVHVAEAIVRPPYFGEVWYDGYDRALVAVHADGRSRAVAPTDPPTDSQGFLAVQAELERRGLLRRSRLGAAACLGFAARDALAVAVELLRRDPAALLCASPSCSVCVAARRLVAGAARG